ncbi:MAG: dehydrogenase [Planctomycetes bacterium RBG_13_63_9]|nr:MAG: dehydrogenase [Planctomycetes bacterium RBG_13_63_9]
MRYQGTVIAEKAAPYGDIVAICDVDREIGEKARQELAPKADLYEDYRKMFDRNDIDVVTIGTPDHWHTAIAIAACRAGADVYCEKPLTLTVDEGKMLCQVVKETGAVLQVGSWQRSDYRFRLACEMVRQGRIGNLKRIDVVLGRNETGGPFPIEPPPDHLNWDLWQGQTPAVPYIEQRCHYTFRWWYEYSGGQMTDWGAHHLDIAQWGAGMQYSCPVEFSGQATFPEVTNGYNVAVRYQAEMAYDNGVLLTVADTGRNGVMFTGEKGRIFVNRGTVSGSPVEDLKEEPLPREQFKLYPHDNLSRPPRMGKLDAIVNQMGNFFDCIKTRDTPISDAQPAPLRQPLPSGQHLDASGPQADLESPGGTIRRRRRGQYVAEPRPATTLSAARVGGPCCHPAAHNAYWLIAIPAC